MNTCGSYAGACASAHRSPDERIASTILGFHEFHAENVLPLDRLLARFLLQRDRASETLKNVPETLFELISST
jgi:hypothetical protein